LILLLLFLLTQLLLNGEHHEKDKHVLEQYKSKADYYICACLSKNNGSNVDRSPSGMLYIRQWNNLQYVSSAAFLLMVYHEYLTATQQQELLCPDGPVRTDELLALAKSQADYILGSNPMKMSYMVGFGSRFPTKVHHRGASIVSYKESNGFIGCTQGFDDWFGHNRENPNVLVGAIVGGPNCEDRFRDDRGNYMQTEACTYNTAPMVGVFAKLNKLEQKPAEDIVSQTSYSFRQM
jgi:Glycosyl hydrolase family 9